MRRIGFDPLFIGGGFLSRGNARILKLAEFGFNPLFIGVAFLSQMRPIIIELLVGGG
jgi:hypothetical protein